MKINTTSSLLFLLLLLAGCKNESYPDQPEEVVTEAVKSNILKDYERAKKFTTRSSWPQLDVFKKDKTPVDTAKGGGIKDMAFHAGIIKSDSAFVRMYNRITKMNTIFVLNKEEGKWKVNMSPEGMMQTSRLTLSYYGINAKDLQTGKMTMDSAQKIMTAYAQSHPNGD